MPDYNNTNSGDDISGIVHEVGENVDEFRVGDRVAAFHEMLAPGGSFAEYAVAWKHTTFFLPKGTSFEGMHTYLKDLPHGISPKTLTTDTSQRAPPSPSLH
jgi:hypothetical protein